MATRVITTKLAVQGESEYRASITRINSEIKTLQSALKLTESEFQNNANSMEALTAKEEALQKLYDAQAEKVKKLESALKNARKAEEEYAAKKQQLTEKIESNNKALDEQDPKVTAAGQAWAKQSETVASCEEKLEKLRNTTDDTSEAQAELEKKITVAKEKMAALEDETDGAAKTAGELLLENKNLNAELKTNEAYLEGAQKGVTNWQGQVNTAKIKLNDLNAEIELNDKYLGEAKESADGCAKSIDEFGERTKESANAADDLRDALAAAGVIKALEKTAEALKACVVASVEFESAMAGVAKTTDLTETELASMADEIQALATQIPATTTEIAGVAEAAGQLGIASDDILSFTEVMVNLGVATNLSSEEAASALAKFANVVKMSADDYEKLGSTIVDLGNNFATTEADIVSMATRLASTGEIVGLTEPQIMAIATALSSVGIEAEAGGSAISKLLKQLETMVATGDETLSDFAAVAGMTAEEFSQAWGEDAVSALSMFINGLGNVDAAGGSAAAVLDDLGITEVRLSNAVLALASSDDILTQAVELANAAWEENTALTNEATTRYETTESKLQMLSNAFDNVKTAVGDQLTPAVGDLADAGTKVLTWAEGFIEDHEAIVPVVTGAATAIGALAIGITGYTAVTKVAEIATTTFSGALSKLPIFAVIAAITGLVTAIGLLTSSMEDTEDEYDSLSAASKRQYDELQELQAQYDRVCEAEGETSAQAQLLKAEIDEQTTAFEANKKTAEEVAAAQEELITAHEELVQSYQDTIDGIDTQKQSATNLAAELDRLIAVENKTVGTKQQILAVVDLLNEAVPNLGLAYDEYSDSLNLTKDAILELIDAEIEREKHQADLDYLKQLKTESANLAAALAMDVENADAAIVRLAEAQKALAQAQEDYEVFQGIDGAAYADLMQPYIEAVETAKADVDALLETQQASRDAYNENKESIDALSESVGEYAEEVAAAEEATAALTEVQDQIEELAQAYKDAYDSARDSIEGQIDLFDDFAAEISTDTDTVEEMMSRWAKQTENLASYTENLQKAAYYGIDEGLVSSLSDGSAESAGYLQTIITEIENLGGSTEGMSADAAAFVADFNASFAETQAAKDGFAEVVAMMETDFETAVAAIEQAADEADFSGVTEAMKKAFADVGVDFQSIGKDAAAGLTKGVDGSLGEITSAGEDAGEALFDGTEDSLDCHSPSQKMKEIGKNADLGLAEGVIENEKEVTDAAKDVGDAITGSMEKSAQKTVESYIKEFEKISAQTKTKLEELKKTVTDTTSSLPNSMENVGQEIVNGMIRGMNNRSSALYSTVKGIVNSALSTAKKTSGVNSPSTVTTEMFEYVGDGMVLGLENRRKKIKDTAQSVVDDALALDVGDKINSTISGIDPTLSLEVDSAIRTSVGAGTATASVQHNYGGVTFRIYQQPGEDDDTLAYRIMDIIQTETHKKEVMLTR